MRILVFGAGNIGCLYAALLARSGQDTTILARGDRLTDLRRRGITLENGGSGERTTHSVSVVDRLDPTDPYDLVLVALPSEALAEVLPTLAGNERTPSVIFFGNHVAGPDRMISALGKERVLLGFPGAAAIPHDGALRYVITSRREQPTTIGELDGTRSARVAAIAQVFERAGFPSSICGNMDAWLKTHVAKILPTAAALFYAGGRVEQLAANDEAIRLMVRAIREGLAILRANDIPIIPSNHRVLQWLPDSLLVFVMKRMLRGETMAIKVGHAADAHREFNALAQDFRAIDGATRVPTPALDQLLEYLPSSTVPALAS